MPSSGFLFCIFQVVSVYFTVTMVGNIKENTKTVHLPHVSYLYVTGGCIFYCYNGRKYKINTKTLHLPHVSYLYVSGGCIFYCYNGRKYKINTKTLHLPQVSYLYVSGECIFYCYNGRKYKKKYKNCAPSSCFVFVCFRWLYILLLHYTMLGNI